MVGLKNCETWTIILLICFFHWNFCLLTATTNKVMNDPSPSPKIQGDYVGSSEVAAKQTATVAPLILWRAFSCGPRFSWCLSKSCFVVEIKIYLSNVELLNYDFLRNLIAFQGFNRNLPEGDCTRSPYTSYTLVPVCDAQCSLDGGEVSNALQRLSSKAELLRRL